MEGIIAVFIGFVFFPVVFFLGAIIYAVMRAVVKQPASGTSLGYLCQPIAGAILLGLFGITCVSIYSALALMLSRLYISPSDYPLYEFIFSLLAVNLIWWLRYENRRSAASRSTESSE
ncbi:MAG: hypothetical protein QM758_07745 [Armatimonas sp.]